MQKLQESKRSLEEELVLSRTKLQELEEKARTQLGGGMPEPILKESTGLEEAMRM